MQLLHRIVATLVVGACGFRVRPKRSSGGQRKGEPGQVHGLFPMGSPGTGKPPLKNARGGPCFPGFRSWTMKHGVTGWLGDYADLATTLTGTMGYRHPYVAGHELDLTENEIREHPCDAETPNLPRGLPRIIHAWPLYTNASQGYSDLLYHIGNVGIATSFTLDRAEAEQKVAAYGWELIGSAVDKGGAIYVGEQVSHLIQQPQTKECILTFQGSSSNQDWIANANSIRSHFCGLTEPDTVCEQDAGECQGGGSFVHTGFRDAFRAIVQSSAWQMDVKPKLSTCSKVYVTGHSQGGAQAELFAACAQKAPQLGEYGYEEDYKYIEWRV